MIKLDRYEATWPYEDSDGRYVYYDDIAHILEQHAEPVAWLPKWAHDRLTGKLGKIADPVTWGVNAPVFVRETPDTIPLYTAPTAVQLDERIAELEALNAEMLQALKRLVKADEYEWFDRDLQRSIIATIAKAEGK